ncbi:MAG TPA: TldD/PmbA family protein [Kofleriaceae bacterium]
MALPSEAQARRLVERVLVLGRASGGAASVSLTAQRGGNTRFAVNEITSSSEIEGLRLAVTVQFGNRSATAVTNQLDDRAIDDVVGRAKRMAKLAPEDPEAMPPLGRQTYKPVPRAGDAATANLPPAARAKAIGAALAAGSTGVSIAGFYEHAAHVRAMGNSAGLWAHHAWTEAGFSCTARTVDGTGSGWAAAASNRVADLDAGAVAKLAVTKATTSAKPGRLDPGRYTVILEQAAVADLLAELTGSFGARGADEGRSFFSRPGGTRVGEKLFPDFITLRTDPTDAALAAQPFDGEGLAQVPRKWIDKGVVAGLTYGRYWAKKQGKPPTGRPSGWILDGGKATRDELIKGVKRGVLITRFWYIRELDPQTLLQTGLTRDGTFLIENGAITRPVTNFRFNESPVQMLARCDGMTASTVAPGGGRRVPTIRTNEFNLASISEAV